MIALDHEYLAEDAVHGDTPGQRPDVQKVYCEVMQMGACKLDAHGREIATFNLDVQAHRLHRIPAWLTSLTGMTEARRARGVPFRTAFARLIAFIGDDTNLWTFSGDWWVLEGNAVSHGLRMPFPPFKRVKPLLSSHHVTLEPFQQAGFNEVCSGGLAQVLGIQLPLIEGVGVHDAAHDARSLAHAIHHLGLT